MITRERFEELFEGKSALSEQAGLRDNALLGLIIINKYLPKMGVEAAEHDIIYSGAVDELIKAGITEEDVITLRRLNWMIDEFDEGLACFV